MIKSFLGPICAYSNISLKKIFWVWLPVVFMFAPSIAQEFGGNPPSIKWQQIDTDVVRVLFPKGLDVQALRVANTIFLLDSNTRRSIGQKRKKIDIVLQNQTIISNGYVGLAPFRSELYLRAPQSGFDLGSNWLDMLSIHEYRHALQFMNTRRGLTGIMSYLTGEFGWSYFSSLSIPNWFWEGDAVVSETALTVQGRGRLPAFYNGYKSLVFDQKTYNYQKARNGSIKDYVPNHYELGFLLCNYGREEYGNDAWKEVVEDAASYKGIFYPFSKAMERHFGLTTKSFYNASINYYRNQWSKQSKFSDHSEIVSTQKKETFTSYQYPYRMKDGNILTYKASFDRIGGFYEIDQRGNEKLIQRQGRVLDNYFSYENNIIIWAELGQDERWSWQTRSNIVMYDMENRKRQRITNSTRYFSPDISNDGSKIVVFYASPDLEYQLHIISSKDGNLLKKVINKENYYYSYPKWALDDQFILALARDELGKTALVRIEISSGDHEVLVPFTDHQLGIPHETDQMIYFSASFTGVDNIFALRKADGKVFQLTDGNLGSYQPFYDTNNDIILFSRFTSRGYELRSIQTDERRPDEKEIIAPVNMPEYDFVAVKAEGGDITKNIPEKHFNAEKYSKSSRLINLHSWSLYFEDPNYQWSLQSNNILNTLNLDLGVRYNRNDDAFTYFFNAEYAQYYPVLTFSASIGKRNTLALVRDTSNVVVDTTKVSWWESIIRPGVTLPFNISSGLYTRVLNLSGYYSYTNVNYTESLNERYENLNDFSYDSYTTAVSLINRRKKARKNIFAKYSQYLNMSYDRALESGKSEQLFIDSEWTFPGLLVNHNLVFQASFQKEDPESFTRFGDNFFYSRGYNRPMYDMIYKVGTNYHFPLAYPDWGLWGITYFYRLRTNVFVDYSRTHYTASDANLEITNYNSLGAELILDTRILNLYDFTFGLRYSYLIDEDPVDNAMKNSLELFIPVMRF